MLHPAKRLFSAKVPRLLSRFPSRSWSCSPHAIRPAARVIFRVTNVSPRRSDSWLNKIPFTANIPYASRYSFTIQNPYCLAIA